MSAASDYITRSREFAELVGAVHDCWACSGVAHSHVLGDDNGRLDARILFVAEAVGRRGGAITGVPLTRDESGKRFADFLAIAGLARKDAFVTNAVLCNPLDVHGRNRSPRASEVARCRPFLARTLDLVQTPVVVALGAVALASLAAIHPHEAALRANAGTALPWNGRTLIPMYHPSRQSTLHRSQSLQERDWRRLGDIVRACT